jgi:hypothetical protein
MTKLSNFRTSLMIASIDALVTVDTQALALAQHALDDFKLKLNAKVRDMNFSRPALAVTFGG